MTQPETITPEQYRALVGKRHKYGAEAVEVDGHKFPSKREARRYEELRLLEQGGVIANLELQPHFPIVVNGVRICTYVGDFRYDDTETGEKIVEDSKGVRTPVFRLKARLMQAVHGIEIREV